MLWEEKSERVDGGSPALLLLSLSAAAGRFSRWRRISYGRGKGKYGGRDWPDRRQFESSVRVDRIWVWIGVTPSRTSDSRRIHARSDSSGTLGAQVRT